jgi:hypothetical protein
MALGLSEKEMEQRLTEVFTIEETKEALQRLILENNRLIEQQLPSLFRAYLTENKYEIDDELEDGRQTRFH